MTRAEAKAQEMGVTMNEVYDFIKTTKKPKRIATTCWQAEWILTRQAYWLTAHGGNHMERAKALVQKLSFDECIEVFNQLPSGSPIMDLLFDRMESLDMKRFEEFLG